MKSDKIRSYKVLGGVTDSAKAMVAPQILLSVKDLSNNSFYGFHFPTYSCNFIFNELTVVRTLVCPTEVRERMDNYSENC